MQRPALPAIPQSVMWMVLLSFLLQVAAIGVARQYRTRPGEDNFGFGFEMGRVGRSIALGQGFSNPYGGNTGRSAWEPPLYPYLIGGVFKIFGIYTYASAWVLLSINSLLAAITTIPVFLIAQRTFNPRIALWSARAWAFNPYVWYWSVHWIWDTTFTPLMLALIFLLAIEMQQWPGWRGWIWFGALWGVGALANPAMLAFLPFCGLWIWRQRYRGGLPSLGGVVLSSFVFFLVLSPWLVRNYEVFGRFVFIRDDFGLQFRLGNNKLADGMLIATLQPNLNNLEFERFARLGEIGYEAECKRLALEWIRANPTRFAIISMKRFFYYWNGVPRPTDSRAPWDFRSSLFLASSLLAIWGLGRALRQKRPGAWLFAGLVATYPTVYYFVFPHARYRHPIEPELFILAVFLLSEVRSRKPRLAEASMTDSL
jgi:4-amino-4-deoxy-L-arabinose transferase-like glycosyltransferase